MTIIYFNPQTELEMYVFDHFYHAEYCLILSLFPRVPLERDNSEEFLKREARAAQLAEEIEASASYKARAALENDERSEEEKYTAVARGERETHTLSSRWDLETKSKDRMSEYLQIVFFFLFFLSLFKCL